MPHTCKRLKDTVYLTRGVGAVMPAAPEKKGMTQSQVKCCSLKLENQSARTSNMAGCNAGAVSKADRT